MQDRNNNSDIFQQPVLRFLIILDNEITFHITLNVILS